MTPAVHRSSAASTGDVLLTVDGLGVGFRTAAGFRDVVEDVGFTVARGRTVCIVGESGSGKSVTCQAILGLVQRNGRQTAGRILFEGRDLATLSPAELNAVRGRRIGMVFQDPLGSLNPVLTVGHQLDETLRRHTDLDAKARKARALELMALVNIPDPAQRLKAYVHQLSGGMAQRVMIAIALACSPQLLIADEPTTALDVTIQAQILDLLERLKAELGMAILFVTHDLGVVAEIADDIVVMRHGRVVEQGEADTLLSRPQQPYTRQLLGAMPSLACAAPVFQPASAA